MYAPKVVTAFLSGLMLACGGTGAANGSGGARGVGGARTLRLVETEPPDEATGVATDVTITAEFETELNGATVTTSSFGLRGDEGADMTAVDSTAMFTPESALGLLGDRFQVQVLRLGRGGGGALRALPT